MKSFHKFTIFAIKISTILLFGSSLYSEIISVPAKGSPTLKEAVDSAEDGDVIILESGLHKIREPIVIKKSITIASRYFTTGEKDYINKTIIDGSEYTSNSTGHKNGDMIIVDKKAGSVRISGISFQNTYYFLVIYSKVHIDHCNSLGSDNKGDIISFESSGYGYVGYSQLSSRGDDAIDIDSRSGDITIEYNTIYDCKDDGLEARFYTASKPITYVIRHNKFIGNREDGLQFIDYDGDKRVVYVYNNLFQGNKNVGLGCMADGNTDENYKGGDLEEKIYVYNNTFDSNNYGLTGSPNMLVLNSIFTNNKYGVAHLKGDSILNYALFYNNKHNLYKTVQSSNILDTNPKYGRDFTLSSNSPAIDAGVSSYFWNGVTIKIENFYGDAPDLGAYEFRGDNDDVISENQAPIINAGEDKIVIAPNNSVTLNAKVNDDSENLTINWRKKEGAGKVTFSNKEILNPKVSFDKQGLYELEVTVNDGEYTRSSTVNVEYVKDAHKNSSVSLTSSTNYFEAENYNTLVSSMDVVTDSTASSSKALKTESSSGYAKYYLVTTSESDDYYLWFKIKSSDTNQHSFSVQFREDSLVQINTPKGSNYQWVKMPVAISTTAGKWKLTIYSTEDGVLIDKLCVTTDKNFTPSNEHNVKSLNVRVSSSSDDAEERVSNGKVYTDSSDLELSYEGKKKQIIGIRFKNIDIPAGATITKAKIRFTVDEVVNEDGELTIYGEDIDDAMKFKSKTNNISLRTKTDNFVNWSPKSWNSVGESGKAQETPDLKAIIQEIINRDGWQSGNSIAMIIEGSGKRVAESYDGSSSKAPILTVEYISDKTNNNHSLLIPISSSIDDVEERVSNGKVYTDSSDLELSFEKSKKQSIGLRFNNIDIPKGAVIKRAYIQFTVDEVVNEDGDLTISGEATANAPIFTKSVYNVTSRLLTNSSTSWQPSKWNIVGESGKAQRTPDIKEIIQEIINIPDWKRGNSIVIIINGEGVRVAESYDGDSDKAPFLKIEYEIED